MRRYVYTINCDHLSIRQTIKVYIQTAFSVVPLPLSAVRFITPCVTHYFKSLHVLPNDAVPSVVLSKVTTLHELQGFLSMHGPCILDWLPVSDVKQVWACACVEEWMRRGYSSLSLRTKSLYICTYVVLKSYTFGLSGVGPGSFTWDPVPNDRTSNPRLL